MNNKQKIWDKLKGLDDLPEYGDIIELEKFQSACKNGLFIDYDGDGHYATETGMDRTHRVCPSKVLAGEVAPEWATHVVWFNR
jgi:hypothetical protein